MKYLTFLDYPTLESTGKSFEAQLKQKDIEIEELRQRERLTAGRLARLESELNTGSKIADNTYEKIEQYQQLRSISEVKIHELRESTQKGLESALEAKQVAQEARQYMLQAKQEIERLREENKQLKLRN